ncbi:ATP-binding protein [Paenibacillus sp. GSMTC-2017]|uniref:ATP-binding protein n=1 Tax=Paenibacillus sp. GSMTC-2017 TaxID=2794350 RepID=UPI0018D6EBF5|nr:ATP-binding protein [Paenibacillus sp. GSMTC-2017]MBH5316712.1 ATP-binding protein [Paenibacillus sp. GSMTC-2017]
MNVEAITEAILSVPNKTMTSLYAADPVEGTYCCLSCRVEMKRVFFPLFQKYVMPSACKCDAGRMEKERQDLERKVRRDRLERHYKRNIISDSLKRASFENFIIRRGTENVFNEAKKFADTFDTQQLGLVLYGKPGNGKSHLMASIHHELDKRGFVCLFLDVSQLFNIAKDTFKFSSKVSLTDIITAAVDCDLLTLDEIGSGILSETEFNDILFPIINGRMGKKTNYSTNLDLNRLSKWFEKGRNGEQLDVDGRLIDRIIGSCRVFENMATSKRHEDALKRMYD